MVDARFVQATGQSGSSHTSHSHICIKKPVIRRINKYHSGFVVCYRNQTFDEKKCSFSVCSIQIIWMNYEKKSDEVKNDICFRWRDQSVFKIICFVKFCSFFPFNMLRVCLYVCRGAVFCCLRPIVDPDRSLVGFFVSFRIP